MLRYLVHEREIKVGHDIEPKRYLAFDSLGLQDIKRIEAAWRMTRQSFGKDSQLRYHHASISLDPSDAKSRHMKNSELVNYGKSFMERFAPGHDYAIAIHRDTEHPHIHLIWNAVNHESGLKFHMAKGKAIDEAIEIKNDLDLEHELKITPRVPAHEHVIEHRHSIPLSDREIQTLSRDPEAYLWKVDIASRIDASASHAKSIGDFHEHLQQQGVQLIQRGKTRTYSFTDQDGKARKIRENRLGAPYGYESINRQISERAQGHQRKVEHTVHGEPARPVTQGLSPLQHGPVHRQPRHDPGEGKIGRGQRPPERDHFRDPRESTRHLPELRDTAQHIIKREIEGPRPKMQRDQGPERPAKTFQHYLGELDRRINPVLAKSTGALGSDATGSQRNPFYQLAHDDTRFSAFLDSGRFNGVLNPESYQQVKKWRQNDGHIRETGRAYIRGAASLSGHDTGRTDRRNYTVKPQLVRSVLRFGAYAQRGYERFREKLQQTVEFTKKLTAKLRHRYNTATPDVTGCFERIRQVEHKITLKIEQEIKIKHEIKQEFEHKYERKHRIRGPSLGR